MPPAALPKTQAAVPTEHDEQVIVVKWADAHPIGHPVRLLLAIPNGGQRHKATAGRLRAEGVRAGVPDLFLPVPRLVNISPSTAHVRSCPGLWIELKRRKSSPSATSSEQRWWHEALRAQGYRVEVCRGADEAIAAITDYLAL